MRRAAFLTLAFLAMAPDAGALGPPDDNTKALPCRPTIACTADLASPGVFELEAGVLFRRLGDTKQWTFPFLAKLTLARFAQVQVGSGGYTTLVDAVPPSRYFSDVTIGMKLQLFEQGPVVPSVSLSGAFGEPVASDQTADAFAVAYVSKDLGPFHADLNLGLNDLALDGPSLVQEWVALALSMALPAPFGVMVESYYFSDAPPLALRDGGCLIALSLTPRPWLVFDFGGDVSYFPATRAYSSFVGMTIAPVRLWP
jgi:hypothetical protein